MDRIDVDPLTMCTHHFTIFNIDCTKLTLKESNQGDADRVTPDDLYAGGEKMIDWAILTQILFKGVFQNCTTVGIEQKILERDPRKTFLIRTN